MAEAPKIPRLIRERVLAQQAGFRSQAEHPDADVLTAFSENALAREERSQVMNHLGACEACREVVMLSQTVLEQDAKPARLAARPLLGWMTLRWASVAAVFAVAIGVVVVERSTRDSQSILIQRGPSQEAAAPARATEQERQTAETAAEPQAAEKDTRVADSRAGGKAIRKPAAAPPLPYVEMRQNSVGRPSAGERRSKSQRSPPAKEDYFFVPNAANAKREMIIDRAVINSSEFRIEPSGVESVAAQGPARPSAPESKTYTFGQAQTSPPAADSTVGGPGAAGSSSSVAPAEQAPAKKKVTDEVTPKVGGFRASERTGSRDDKAAAVQSELASSSDDANFQAKDQLAGLTTENLAAAGPMPMRWRLREGKLQHSADDGKTWQEVNLEPGVNLHSLWIQGGTVWAGGTGGSLFHVTEQGKNAVRIPLKVSGGGDVSQTVVTISFSDERHGVIRLENGHILRTSDGGKTWERF
jgi:hypothetical protein